MRKILLQLLKKIVDDLETGNSNIDEKEELEIIDALRRYTRKDEPISKYQAYTYLNMSRASFDNLVREGKLPRGRKRPGFKELSWTVRELNEYLGK